MAGLELVLRLEKLPRSWSLGTHFGKSSTLPPSSSRPPNDNPPPSSLPPLPPSLFSMNLNVSAAQDALSNPSAALQDLLSNASPEAQSALQEARSSPVGDAAPPSAVNGQQRSEGERVQVVDEEKKFR